MSSADLVIDLDAVAANWQALDRMSAGGTETAAVVKANAYGLGLKPVAERLARAGGKSFFVAQASEGASLRKAIGPGAEIFVLTGHMSGDSEAIAQAALTPVLTSISQMTRHFEALAGHPFALQIETGMHRLGITLAEWAAARDMVLAAGPSLIMSHLACADEADHPLNEAQLHAFRSLTDGLGIRRSLAATGGILLGSAYHFDLTRPGIGLYGGLPFAQAKPVVTLSLPIVQLVDVAPGESVGYGATHVARAQSRIATVAGGYADGILRSLSGKPMLFHGRTACPLVGRISMDLLTIDITHLSEVPDHLDLICEFQSVDQLASQAGTIGYEILTSLGARYERTYLF